jgi:cytoskeleton-associated protein 5
MEDLDPRLSAEPVDITPKIPSNFQTSLASSKWKDRKEALDELLTIITSVPRIQEAPDLGDISKLLAARVQGDANINCVMTAANCLKGLASGLMSSFARYREAVVPPMLERLKERKESVTDCIGAALDAIFSTVRVWLCIHATESSHSMRRPHSKISSQTYCQRFLTKTHR